MFMLRFDTTGIMLWHLCCTLVGHKYTDSVIKHAVFYKNFMYDTNKQMNHLMGVLRSWERKTVIVYCYHDSGQICTCSNNRASPQRSDLWSNQLLAHPMTLMFWNDSIFPSFIATIAFEGQAIKQKDAIFKIPRKANLWIQLTYSMHNCQNLHFLPYFRKKIVK